MGVVALRCILSKFYIKPQLSPQYMSRDRCCILSKFYIKPQRGHVHFGNCLSCILSKFYIKPQPFNRCVSSVEVVSYRNSTSNHNSPYGGRSFESLYLIEILHQTTTRQDTLEKAFQLYLIEILHQTTTESRMVLSGEELYLIEILHQTTTPATTILVRLRCILSKFYIKPQRRASY